MEKLLDFCVARSAPWFAFLPNFVSRRSLSRSLHRSLALALSLSRARALFLSLYIYVQTCTVSPQQSFAVDKKAASFHKMKCS